jgi:hypothetical protein
VILLGVVTLSQVSRPTTVGMMVITCVVALAAVRAQRVPVLGLSVQIVAGALSLALGGWMAWKLGVGLGTSPGPG